MRLQIGLCAAILLLAGVAVGEWPEDGSGGGSGGSGGHTIRDEGTDLPQRAALNFTGAGITCTDDSANNETQCDVPGGGGGAGDAIEVEQGTNLGTFDAVDTTARFDDGGDIDFRWTDGPALRPDVVDAVIKTSVVTEAHLAFDTATQAELDAKSAATSTANALAVFSNTTGDLKDSKCIYSESGTTAIGGAIDCGANDAGPSELTFYEDADNGTNTLKVVAPAAITTNITCTLQDDSTPFDACITDPITETELDTEAELEAQLTDVTNVFTNNDGSLADDNLADNSLTDLGDVTGTPANGHVLQHDGTNWVSGTTLDMGGGTVILPNGSAPADPTTAGQVVWDTDGCLRIKDGTASAAVRSICAPRFFYPDDYKSGASTTDGVQEAIDAASAAGGGAVILTYDYQQAGDAGGYQLTGADANGCALTIPADVAVVGSIGGINSNGGTFFILNAATATSGICLQGDRAMLVNVRVQSNLSDLDGFSMVSVGDANNYPSGWFVGGVSIRGNAGVAGATDDADYGIRVRALKGTIYGAFIKEVDVGISLESSTLGKSNDVKVENSIIRRFWQAAVRIPDGGSRMASIVRSVLEADGQGQGAIGIDIQNVSNPDAVFDVKSVWIEGAAANDFAAGIRTKVGSYLLLGNAFDGANSMTCSIEATDSGTVFGMNNLFDLTLPICDTGTNKATWGLSGGRLPSTLPADFKSSLTTILATDCTAATGFRGDICIDSDAAAPTPAFLCKPTGGNSCDTVAEWVAIGGDAGAINPDGDATKEVSISGTDLLIDPDDDGTAEVRFCVVSGVLHVMYEDTDTADGSSWTECGFDDGVMTCGSDADGVCDGTI